MDFDAAPEPVTPHSRQTPRAQIQSLRRLLIIGLVTFSLLTLLLALFLIVASVRKEIDQSNETLTAIQAQVIQLRTPAPELAALLITLTNTQSLADKLTAASPTAGLQWPVIIGVISNYNSTGLTLTALTQADNRITLRGQATDDSMVVDYARMLEASARFSKVVLQSLTLLPPVTPTSQGAAPPPNERVEFMIIIELSVERS